jgi:hypothetical protein
LALQRLVLFQPAEQLELSVRGVLALLQIAQPAVADKNLQGKSSLATFFTLYHTLCHTVNRSPERRTVSLLSARQRNLPKMYKKTPRPAAMTFSLTE